MLTIADRTIGPGHPCFIIAEAGVNHNGDIDLAMQMINAAVKAGADAIKFQTFKADNLVTVDADMAEYQKANTGSDKTQYHMLKALELPDDAWPRLKQYCDERHIVFLSTPFDEESAQLLKYLGIPAYKIGSGEVTNIPLLKFIAGYKKPIILSTGMASLGEIEQAIGAIKEEGNDKIVLLHCVTSYPAPYDSINLKAMNTLKTAFGLEVGYSDHTEGIEISIAAAALGASVIEKHFTLDRNMPGPDHKASLEPHELKQMVRSIRHVEAGLGDGIKVIGADERKIKEVVRRSIVANTDIKSGAVIEKSFLTAKRPAGGLPPAFIDYIAGRRARHDIPKNTVITIDMII
ncbi:N-acetylneuraminate synthase [Mahella sp.]|uniref:N-acetylneuraminate synthase n=1 Tax=Mahella sp. TaxID=2798721 RepID=UPI0025C51EC9|nr:N-acetylneuraminate synthase [Mahella sp.]MBZ4666102.1 N-acetylneuraminate synthase [Mahella sp.]